MGIKNDTVNERNVSFTVSAMGIDPNFNRMPILGCILPFGWGAFCVFGVQMGRILDEIDSGFLFCDSIDRKLTISSADNA